MGYLIINWLISAVAVVVAGKLIPGVEVRNFGSALFAAVIIGLVNATLGWVLTILTIPLTLITFGLFLLVLNAILFWIASALVPGLTVRSFWSALFGALVLSIVGSVLRGVFLG
jgi:putative membrane protein